MMFFKALVAALMISVVEAHHVLTSFSVDGIRQHNVIRQPGSQSPITNPNNQYLACGLPPGNGQGMHGTDKAIIQSGSKLTFEWHTNWSGSTPGPEGVTDDSHKGPCAIYMRKVEDSVTAVATGTRKPGWFKIWEDGVDSTGKFCTTRMRENGGFFTGTVPKHLENGDYLIRAETVTLNNAAEPHNQPQWYVGCAQVTLRDSEAPFLKPFTVRIPSGDYANLNHPGLRYNIWYPERTDYSDYGTPPGPAVFYDGSDEFEQEPPDKPTTEDPKLKETITIIGSPTTITSKITIGIFDHDHNDYNHGSANCKVNVNNSYYGYASSFEIFTNNHGKAD
ncbi:hypothetical protein ABW19_dt0203478 [Dactylella cylindrospora]|nr:hypothetical protein ABW19_dt0203478 [Dactylella cylindrospora]